MVQPLLSCTTIQLRHFSLVHKLTTLTKNFTLRWTWTSLILSHQWHHLICLRTDQFWVSHHLTTGILSLGTTLKKLVWMVMNTFKSLVHLSLYMKMVMLMQQMITNLWLTVHALTVTQQLIQQLVKLQMKVGMRLTQTEHLVRRMPTMVLLQQSSRVNQWTSS